MTSNDGAGTRSRRANVATTVAKMTRNRTVSTLLIGGARLDRREVHEMDRVRDVLDGDRAGLGQHVRADEAVLGSQLDGGVPRPVRGGRALVTVWPGDLQGGELRRLRWVGEQRVASSK
ncbi:MAG: hypothetical protein DLM61_01815 [Pseudonocardiales bacterium]|nr:MAG: hypothetical protein DLM61_01815 [Pseudonocardiales bacterium]